MWLGKGNADPCPGNWQHYATGKSPKTISELRSFMGFCNYYSGYVRMYADLLGPLHKMLQVGKFDGGKQARKNWHGQRKPKKRSTS